MRPSIRFRVFERDHFTCQYCGRKSPDVALEVDHIHPRCKGGGDHMENLTTACRECNRGKSGRPLASVLVERVCFGGPLDARTQPCPTHRTVLWVFRGPDAETFAIQDEWLLDEDGEFTTRLRWGHPGFGAGGSERNDAWRTRYALGHEPTLLGFYVTSEYPGISAPGRFEWWDMERMLVEMSA